MKINTQIHTSGNKGRVTATADNDNIGEVVFSFKSNQLLVIEHTEVDDAVQGQNVGRTMLESIFELARNKNMKIEPRCPYAKHVFEEEPALADLWYHRDAS